MQLYEVVMSLFMTLLKMGTKAMELLTTPLLPPEVSEILDMLPDWVFPMFQLTGLESWGELNLLWLLGAGIVVFVVLCVVKWVIGIIM